MGEVEPRRDAYRETYRDVLILWAHDSKDGEGRIASGTAIEDAREQ